MLCPEDTKAQLETFKEVLKDFRTKLKRNLRKNIKLQIVLAKINM